MQLLRNNSLDGDTDRRASHQPLPSLGKNALPMSSGTNWEPRKLDGGLRTPGLRTKGDRAACNTHPHIPLVLGLSSDSIHVDRWPCHRPPSLRCSALHGQQKTLQPRQQGVTHGRPLSPPRVHGPCKSFFAPTCCRSIGLPEGGGGGRRHRKHTTEARY